MKRTLASSLALVLVVCSVHIISCGKKKHNDPPDTSSTSQQIVDNTQLSTLSVGTIQLSIPANAVDKDTTISLANVDDPAAISANFASDPKASAAVAITAKKANGDDLAAASGQLMLNMVYDDTLALTAVEKKTDNLCVLAVGQDSKQYFWRRISLGVSETDKTIKLSTKYFGTYQVVYCGTSTPTGFTEIVASAPPVSTAAATELEGSWTTGCQSTGTSSYLESMRSDVVMVGDAMQFTNFEYTGSATCEDKFVLLVTHERMNFTIGEAVAQPTGAKKFDAVYTAYDLTPFSVTYQVLINRADEFNSEKYCEITDWAVGVTRDLLGKNCGQEYGNVTSGEKSYDIYTNDTKGLCFGDMTATGVDGTTEAKRPTTVSTGTNCFKRM